MCQCTPTPEAGIPLFHRAYALANLLGECRTVARTVPDVIPDGLGEFTLDKLQQISDLASVVARLVGTAEDLAYAMASDLHDVYLSERKGS